MANRYDSKLSDQRHDQKLLARNLSELERAKCDAKATGILRFSTWLIDTFDRGENTSSLLIIFPFPIHKKDTKMTRLKEVIEDAFQEIYSKG